MIVQNVIISLTIWFKKLPFTSWLDHTTVMNVPVVKQKTKKSTKTGVNYRKLE